MRIFGHRGSPGIPRFGENTRTSFRKALDDGADGFELDVRRCGDGTLVVVHDATIDRTTTGRGRVRSLSYDQLCLFDAGHGDSIPRLSDIIDEFGAGCTIHVELKESGLAQDVAAIARQHRRTDRIIVSGFDSDDNDGTSGLSWMDLAAIASDIPTALLATRRKIQRIGIDSLIQAARNHGARALHPSRDAATRELIETASRADLPVRIWTVNNAGEAQHWRDLGAEAIFSDLPSLCLKALRL